MLDFAINHKEQLLNIHREFVTKNTLHCKFFLATNWFNYTLTVEDSSWDKIQMVSLDSSGQVVGYLSAAIDAAQQKVTDFSLISYKKGMNRNLYPDANKFMEELLTRFRKVSFYSFVSSPADKINDKIIKRFNGRVAGIAKEHTILLDNKIYDLKTYEIISQTFNK